MPLKCGHNSRQSGYSSGLRDLTGGGPLCLGAFVLIVALTAKRVIAGHRNSVGDPLGILIGDIPFVGAFTPPSIAPVFFKLDLFLSSMCQCH